MHEFHIFVCSATFLHFSCFGFVPVQINQWIFFTSFVDLPSVLWYCWLGLLTCKNRLPYNLYCVGGDVKHCSLTHLLRLFERTEELNSFCMLVSVSQWQRTVMPSVSAVLVLRKWYCRLYRHTKLSHEESQAVNCPVRMLPSDQTIVYIWRVGCHIVFFCFKHLGYTTVCHWIVISLSTFTYVTNEFAAEADRCSSD